MITIATESLGPGYEASYQQRGDSYRAIVRCQERGQWTEIGVTGWCRSAWGAARRAEAISADHARAALRAAGWRV